ncbi:MAG: cytochrome c family protein [Caulobacteraceae bacterium]|nr:cytochrome c family protein [Caulobacteraceae bacterium]
MRHAATAAFAIAASLLVAACGQSGESGSGGEAAAPKAPELTAEQKQALLASLPAPYNTGDLENGRVKFGLCRSCHTITEGGPNQVGPNLYGVFGRKAGTHEGYSYSKAMLASNIVWDGAVLDQWLDNPRTFLPGTKMTFAGLHDEKDRIDLIAYLKVESGYQAPAAK